MKEWKERDAEWRNLVVDGNFVDKKYWTEKLDELAREWMQHTYRKDMEEGVIEFPKNFYDKIPLDELKWDLGINPFSTNEDYRKVETAFKCDLPCSSGNDTDVLRYEKRLRLFLRNTKGR